MDSNMYNLISCDFFLKIVVYGHQCIMNDTLTSIQVCII